MISHTQALDRKIKESNVEEIFERLCIPTADQNFAEVLAEFGIEIRNNPFFESYIRNVGDKEKEYRQKPEIASILQKATYTPTGQQALDQKMLTRRERKSEYISLWYIRRFSELYDISLHEQVRAELIAKQDMRDLADFEAGVTVISNILEGDSNTNLSDFYLPHAHRVMFGIIRFFDKQKSVSGQDQNIPDKILPHSLIEQELENGLTRSLDSCSKNKSKEQNKTFKPNQQPVLVKTLFDERRVLLSTDGKEDIKFELFKKNNPSEQTNQIKVYFEIIKGPISKNKLKAALGLTDKEIERAYRSLNKSISIGWRFSEYLKYDKKHTKYYVNPSYPTTLSSL